MGVILKGNQRGGGPQLADHLLNKFDNNRAEVMEVRGTIAQDLHGAFAEITAQGKATKIKHKFFYHLSINPDHHQMDWSNDNYLDVIERTERELDLVGQSRIIVLHEKADDHGVLREHYHVVWSRVDTRKERVKAVDISHDRLKLRTVAREFSRDHGLELPNGMKPGKARASRLARFNKEAVNENHAERQQRERSGIDKKTRMADIATCWKETGNGAAFIAALEGKGYYLARGDQRSYVVLDLHGEVYSLSKQLPREARKLLPERLKDHPAAGLDGVIETQSRLEQKRRDAVLRAVGQDKKPPTELEARIAALKDLQRHRRENLDDLRINLLAQHMAERDGLKASHESEKTGVASGRLQKQPKGIMAFLQRVTGIKMLVEAKQQREDKARDNEHARQTEILTRTHAHELSDMDRRYRALDRLDRRENRSAEIALKREAFQQLLEQCAQRALKPEFDRAAQGTAPPVGTGGGKEIDLREEFNREVANRLDREDRDRDNDGPDRAFDPRKR